MRIALCVTLLATALNVAWALDSANDLVPFEELRQLDLEDLMEIDVVVTSAAKKPQQLSKTAAAVFVITPEDIRRSGATTIPEALRMVPGVQVAHIDANKWAVSIRGFNGRLTNKLLVLMDGRTVYTPLFSGVFWNEQDTLLEDIARIEVIRGPGASLWGANAVNGVINILTKRARDTQGTLLEAGAGTQEKGFGAIRYGGQLGDDTHYRVYTKYFKRDNFATLSEPDAADEWDVLRGGFRIDWNTPKRDLFTLQGDIYGGDAGQTITLSSLSPPFAPTLSNDIDLSGGNLLGRWKHAFSNSSGLALQLYFDRTERDDPGLFKQTLNVLDFDFQHNFRFGERQEVVWGLGYRFNDDDTDGSFTLSVIPDSRSFNLFSAFVQNDITLVENRWRLTLGSKFEHNDFTGFEVQPNLRLLWTPHERHTLWSAISRAVRTPSRIDHDIRLNQQVVPGAPPAVISLFGDEAFDSEELLAFELGYRFQPLDRLFIDIAAFYNIYDKLRTVEPRMAFLEITPLPLHAVSPFIAGNKMEGETYGVELATDWRLTDYWRLQTAYSFLQMQLRLDSDSGDTMSEAVEGQSPKNQISFRSSVNLSAQLDFDLWLRYEDRLPSLDIDSYVNLDARLAWRPHKKIELSIVGQNLVDDRRLEFIPEFVDVHSTLVKRGVYGKLLWRY